LHKIIKKYILQNNLNLFRKLSVTNVLRTTNDKPEGAYGNGNVLIISEDKVKSLIQRL